jgi:hypothetical protein
VFYNELQVLDHPPADSSVGLAYGHLLPTESGVYLTVYAHIRNGFRQVNHVDWTKSNWPSRAIRVGPTYSDNLKERPRAGLFLVVRRYAQPRREVRDPKIKTITFWAGSAAIFVVTS